jgi:acyl-CoA oxidase
LEEIHAVSSVLKAKTAWMSTEAIRESRRMMGGHGFSAYSKMGALYSNNDVNNTWEGENNVLIQQTTKYILQNLQKAMKGKEVKSPLLKFFNEVPAAISRPCLRRNSRQRGRICLTSLS